MARLLPAAVVAVALAGCGGAVPEQAAEPVVALSYGQEIAELDAQLAGVARADDDGDTRHAATGLWRRAVRTALDLRKAIDATGPVGDSLLTAAEEAREAARALQPPRPPQADAEAAGHLRRSATALSVAADELAGMLPTSAGPELDALRTALPPG